MRTNGRVVIAFLSSILIYLVLNSLSPVVLLRVVPCQIILVLIQLTPAVSAA